MKIKALKTFVSGRFSASRGEVLEVTDTIGQKLVKSGIVEAQNDPEKPEAPAADKIPVVPKKKAGTGKSGAKTSPKE